MSISSSGLSFFVLFGDQFYTMNIFRNSLATLAICIVGNMSCQAQTDPKGGPDNTLEIQRRKIDSLDKQLIEILGARERAVKEIGIYKAAHHIPPLQPARFQEVVKKSIEAGAKEGLSAEFITRLMNDIHEESLRIEEGR